MPTSYFIITNDYVKNLINRNDLQKLDFYLDESNESNQLKLYHILSYAIDIGNINVLDHFKDKINLNYSPDGNAYNLLHLAIENYVKTSDAKFYDITILLVRSHKSNHSDEINSYGLRDLIPFMSKHNNYKLITELVRDYNISLTDVYYYSIAWGYTNVFDYITNNLIDMINLDYDTTCLGIQMACRFDNHSTARHVAEFLENKFPEKKVNTVTLLAKCGLGTHTYILSQELDCVNLTIPPHITHIETTYNFNQDVSTINWPPNLQSIRFGANFNQPIELVMLPPTVSHISFGINNNWSSFAKPLGKFNFPKSLKEYINRGPGAGESLDKIIFPDSTQIIRLGYGYNIPINNFKFPSQIKEFEFGCGYSQSLKDIIFPQDMILKFYQTDPDPDPIQSINTPIYGLHLMCLYGELTHLPPGLKIIICWSEEDKKKIKCALPDQWKWKENANGNGKKMQMEMDL